MIWLTGLVAVLALTFAMQARVHMALGRNIVANAQAEALADGGVMLAVAGLHRSAGSRAQPEPDFDRPARDGPSVCGLPDGSRLVTRFEDEAGRIDLNTASDDLLRALLVGLGVPSEQTERLLDALVDYRDADGARRPAGAEATEYAAAGRQYGPRNAALETVGELQRVLGFTPDIMAKLRPHVTVHSGLRGLDPRHIGTVLRDLIATGASLASPSLASPALGERGKVASVPDGAVLPRAFIAVSARTAFRVTVLAVTPSNARFVRQATLSLVAVQRRQSDRRDPTAHGERSPPRPAGAKLWSWSRPAGVDEEMLRLTILPASSRC